MSDSIQRMDKVDSEEKKPPRVLISYSHDSLEHSARVLELSNCLREYGIDCWIDQYDPSPREGWPLWMERQVEKADFVLALFTERYFHRYRGEEVPGIGQGVAWESVLIQNELYASPHLNNKFIPILFKDEDRKWISLRFQGYTKYVIKSLELKQPSGDFSQLYRRLTNQPAIDIPQLGVVHKLRKLDRPPVFSKNEDSGELANGNGPAAVAERDFASSKIVCQQWKKRLEFFLNEEVKITKDSELFEILEKIDEARRKIAEHCSDPQSGPSDNGNATGLVQNWRARRFVKSIIWIVAPVILILALAYFWYLRLLVDVRGTVLVNGRKATAGEIELTGYGQTYVLRAETPGYFEFNRVRKLDTKHIKLGFRITEPFVINEYNYEVPLLREFLEIDLKFAPAKILELEKQVAEPIAKHLSDPENIPSPFELMKQGELLTFRFTLDRDPDNGSFAITYSFPINGKKYRTTIFLTGELDGLFRANEVILSGYLGKVDEISKFESQINFSGCRVRDDLK